MTTRLTDRDPTVRKSGVIALQMWGKCEVEFSNILLKRLDGDAVVFIVLHQGLWGLHMGLTQGLLAEVTTPVRRNCIEPLWSASSW